MRGTVTKRGNSWLLRLFLGRDPETGKQRRPTRTVHGTKKEADKVLRDWISEYESGRVVTPSTATLDTYMDEWFRLACAPDVSPRTLNDYRKVYARYVGGTLGSTQLSRLTTMDLQRHYTKMREAGRSERTIQYVHGIVKQALSQAVRWSKLSTNPADHVKKPRRPRKKKPVHAFDEAQLAVFREQAVLTPYAALFDVAVTSGMRPGECLGLGRDCIDWDSSRIRVERAAIYEQGQPVVLGPPKTPESFRTIPMPPSVMAQLRQHLADLDAHAERMGERWTNEHNLVFPNRLGGFLDYHNLAGRTFKGCCRRGGLPREFSLYSLRHTMATLLLLAGENPKVVQERLGHSSIVQTMDTYSHVLPTMQEGAAAKLEQILFGSTPDPQIPENRAEKRETEARSRLYLVR